MRFLFPSLALLLAACASTPTPEPGRPEPQAPSRDDDGHAHRTLNGMTASELMQHFGTPQLQIREGDATKLQFAGPACVLDAYLYPQGSGAPRVTHVEARNFQGIGVNTQGCVHAIEQRRGLR